MGLIKLVVVGAVGVYSYRSVTRVNQLVRQVGVPSKSLLGKYNSQTTNNRFKEYKDAYKITLPPKFKLLKNTGSLDELFVYDLARNFFTCKVFSNLEKPLLVAALKTVLRKNVSTRFTLDNYNTGILEDRRFRFKVGDEVLVWKVISRENNEILMKWEVGNLSGTSWFYIPSDENCLVFGSSFLVPKENYGEEKQFKSEPKKLYLDAARNLPYELPTVSKVKSTVIKATTSILTPIHRLYSKYLLLSTYNKVMEEKEKTAPRKPV